MTDEEIKALQDENAKLKAENTTLMGDLQAKDAKITEQAEHIRAQGKNFKLYRDMTQEERDLYTEKELELKKQQDEIFERTEQMQKEQEAFRQTQRESVIDNLAKKYARGDEELANKIKVNLSKLKDVDGAMTEQELTPHIETSVAMLGNLAPTDPLRDANNYSGNTAPATEPNFADTPEGQALSKDLNIIPNPQQ